MSSQGGRRIKDNHRSCLGLILLILLIYSLANCRYPTSETKATLELNKIAYLTTGEMCIQIMGEPMRIVTGTKNSGIFQRLNATSGKESVVYVWQGKSGYYICAIIDTETDRVLGTTCVRE